MNILIVGGGFGGVKAAKELAKRQPDSTITLISDNVNFCYFPALYGTAAGHSKVAAWIPLEDIFTEYDNVEVRLDTAASLNSEQKTVSCHSGRVYSYDKLILSLGSVTTYFNIKGLDSYSFGIKSAAEIYRLKKHLQTSIADSKTTQAHYVIIGGGPTGVELAAMLGQYIKRLSNYYGADARDYTIDLIEASPRILPRMSEATSRRVESQLRRSGVTVQTNQKVESASADGIVVSGKPLKSQTVIWTSGVANNPFFAANGDTFSINERGRVVVDDRLLANDDIYVIGDNAATRYSGLAQTAVYDGIFVAHDIDRKLRGKKPKNYTPRSLGTIVPVGKNWAAFEWKGLKLYGLPASLLRKVADFIGYMDILSFGQALRAWQSSDRIDETVFVDNKS